jgi:methylglutaconyl-CoA hydratase
MRQSSKRILDCFACETKMGDLRESIDPLGVASLTLNRPQRHNAFDDALIANMTKSLRRLEGNADVRVIVLAGAGRSFCAGADIGWMRRAASQSMQDNLSDAVAFADLMTTLDRISKPTLAVVHGGAYGGAVGLVACCDIVVASERATFCLSEVRIGVIPAVIGPYVIRAIGPRQARRFMISGEVIPADHALEIGLVHEVAEDAELEATRDRLVEALLSCAPGAQAEAKSLVTFCEGRPIDEELSSEMAQWIAKQRASPEGKEGLSAFLEKRRPAWWVNRNKRHVRKAVDR